MQVENSNLDEKLDFIERTDSLAKVLGCNIRDLEKVIGLSATSICGYRTGRVKISKRAIAKLEIAERAHFQRNKKTPQSLNSDSNLDEFACYKMLSPRSPINEPSPNQIELRREILEKISNEISRSLKRLESSELDDILILGIVASIKKLTEKLEKIANDISEQRSSNEEK